jgi:hypothetical protein
MELTLASVIGIIQLVGTIFVFCVIKFNDLHHLHESVKTIVERQEGISTKVNSLAEDLAYVKGNFDLYKSKKIFKKSKKILNKV